MAAIELYTPQGAEMVSGMMYEPYEHHLVGGYVRYISPHIIIIIINARSNDPRWDCLWIQWFLYEIYEM